MSRRPAAVLLLTMTLALLAGCGAAEPAEEPTAPSQTPEASLSPEPSPSAGAAPVRAFDGDCAQLLTSAQRDDLLGAGSLSEAERDAEMAQAALPWLEPVGTLGGLACHWFAAEGADLPEGIFMVGLRILPADAVPPEFAEAYASPICEPSYDASVCRLGRTVGEVWIGADAGPLSTEAPTELLNGALDAAAANLAGATMPQPAAVTEEFWTIPNCGELFAEIRLEELIGPYIQGYWEGSEQPEDVVLAAAGVARSCPAFTDNERIAPEDTHYILTPQIAPGGAWQWEQLVADSAGRSTPLEVAGATEAFAVGAGLGSSNTFATDGTNIVSVPTDDLEVAGALLGRIVTALAD